MSTAKSSTVILTALLALGASFPQDAHAKSRSKKHRDSQTAAQQDSPDSGASSTTASAPSSAPPAAQTRESEPSASPSSGSDSSAPAGTVGSSTSDKVGRFMANFKIGPALGAHNAGHQGAIVLDLGWSVLPNKNAYLLLPLQFHFAQGGGAVILPVGFQYDIGIAKVPGLYLYPRLSIGYAAFIASAEGQTVTSHFGVLTPEFGAKYVFKGRWNLGGEIFSLPIFFTNGGAAVQYRILLSAGVNF